MARVAFPEPRTEHESALIGNELHLFGGRNAKNHYFPRNEIWTCNVQEEKKWIRRFAEVKNIPPPCRGAQCVVINGIMYSYGGEKEDACLLGEVFGLDPKKMKWIQVATLIHGKKPWERFFCCLWAIGGRMIMFGGFSGRIPRDRLQSGAQRHGIVNNEIYEFVFEEGREKGYWLDVELSGERPQPRGSAAMATIDQHRGLLHGGSDGYKSFSDAFVIDLREKKWIRIDFLPKPSARYHHRICRLMKRGFKRKNCFLMIGGYQKELLDSGYIIDFDEQKSYKIVLTPDVAPIWNHTLHCVANQDGSAHLIISGGFDDNRECQQIMKIFTLGPSNESYTKIESLLLATSTSISDDRFSIRDVDQQMERMREQCETLQAGNSELTARCRDLQRQIQQQRHAMAAESRRHETEKNEIRRQLHDERQAHETEKNDIRTQLHAERHTFESQRQSFQSQRQALESRCQELESQRQTLQDSLQESRRSLDQFVQVLNISPQQIELTRDKLGTGAYADVLIGHWHGMDVAVKQFHELITTERTIPTFRREVLTASRLHHPNIVRVCGAIMRPGLPFQIVSELLEGSVSEAMDAAHFSGSYLSTYEQLSIAVEMTSAITYLHELSPRPYVHGDIRPTNVLLTRDMRVKVADLGAAHLLDSSKSAGPLSPNYLAPERMAPTSAHSSLPSDVYSLGVSLIEIFTGVGPIPEERSGQLSDLVNRAQLHQICSRMISGEERIERRPTSGECLTALRREIAEVLRLGIPPMKRLVKGKFGGEGENRRHKVVLSEVLF
ncbi:uncharacterized protein [Oscarella lobularis]|uniref:uncharacterized protein n=1 Tax=Oscarella lobularis TaxID=121494 RepID=UPI003313A9C3